MLALLLLQATVIPEWGLSGGVAALVLWFWRQDRADRAAEKLKDAERYEALATDFRQIVQSNTEAMTKLSDALATRTVQCPFVTQAALDRVARA